MINKITFGQFLRQKRIEKGLTQKELSEKLFLSESAISKWEKGRSYPDITMIPDICAVLDVSEHELISGANDTEYHAMKRDARLYRKITETFFWGFTVSYIAAFVICLICDLAINKRLSFSLTVFASLLTAFTFVPTLTRFTKKHKLSVFAVSTYLSLVILFAVCCLSYGQNWFGIAASGTLLGYAVIFLPFILKKYSGEKIKKFTPAIYFAACAVLIILLLLVTRITVYFNLHSAVLITLLSLVPFFISAAVGLIGKNKFFKGAADSLVFGASLYALPYCLYKILGDCASYSYAVNFLNWHDNINGNIYLLILLASVLLSAVLIILGFKKKSS